VRVLSRILKHNLQPNAPAQASLGMDTLSRYWPFIYIISTVNSTSRSSCQSRIYASPINSSPRQSCPFSAPLAPDPSSLPPPPAFPGSILRVCTPRFSLLPSALVSFDMSRSTPSFPCYSEPPKRLLNPQSNPNNPEEAIKNAQSISPNLPPPRLTDYRPPPRKEW